MPAASNPRLSELSDKLIRLFESLARNTVVGISGRGGSWKSTLTEGLEKHLRGSEIEPVTFHIDDFVFPTAIRNTNQAEPGKARYFDSYDFETLFNGLLRPLKEQKSFSSSLPMLNRQVDRQEHRSITVSKPTIILVEGVQLFRVKAADVFDFKIWVEVPFEEGLRRALGRVNHLGVPMTPQQKEEQYVKWSTAGYVLYEEIDRPMENSNLVINGLLPVCD